jgi:hypothetical protein
VGEVFLCQHNGFLHVHYFFTHDQDYVRLSWASGTGKPGTENPPQQAVVPKKCRQAGFFFSK